MTSERVFEHTRVYRDGQPLGAYRIACGACPEDETYRHGGRPYTAGAQFFRKLGWVVGKAARKDRCPACAGKNKEPNVMADQNSKIARAPGVHPAHPGHPIEAAPRAEPPREMSKDERRIIFAKIDEVYVGASTGYEAGWSDERIAKDLGTPRAYVSSVRDQFFGPERSDEAEVKALSLRHDALASELAAFAPAVARIEQFVKTHATIGARFEQLKKELAEIGSKLKAVVGK